MAASEATIVVHLRVAPTLPAFAGAKEIEVRLSPVKNWGGAGQLDFTPEHAGVPAVDTF